MKRVKTLSLLLALCMIFSLAMPVSAFADEDTAPVEEPVVEVPAEVPDENPTLGESDEDDSGSVPTLDDPAGAPAEGDTSGAPAEGDAEVSAPADEPAADEPGDYSLTNPDEGVAATSLTIGTKPADGTTTGQPFSSGTGTSSNFRIPALVTLSDGTLVAACDARWNYSFDGYGLDTIVSYSTNNGANWSYTFANYLGDNGNVYNTDSTAFIDPALAVTSGDTIFMLVDLYPHGTYIGNVKAGTGFDSNGHLLLSDNNGSSYNYYVGDFTDGSANIYQTDGTQVDGYTVNAYYNISGNGVSTNLFFSDSPYQVLSTSYLYLTKSTDKGATWSAPMMLNPQVKDSSYMFYGVGPGRGLVTSTGRIMFPCYTYTTQDGNTSVIYSDDNGATWHRSASTSVQTSEAALVEADGRIYMFTRHGGYFVSSDNGETWGTQQSVGISYNTGCQISAITYSEKIDGKTAILLSAPGSTSSRTNGKIFVGLVQDNGSISWDYTYTVNNSAYAYSCLTELNDGNIGLLYESDSAAITYTSLAITDIAKGATISGSTDTDTDTDPVDPKVIDVVLYVGQTYKNTIDGVNYSERVDETTLDKSIATVSAEYKQVPGGTKEVKATSITSGSSYYIKSSDGQYLNSSASWVSDISSAALWTANSYGSGYRLTNSSSYLRYQNSKLSTTTSTWSATTWSFSNGTFSYSGWSSTYTLGDAYTIEQTDPVDATTVTINAVAPGETSVVVGNCITYNITVKELPPLVTPETTPFVANTGVGDGKAVTKLTTSVGLTFDLDLNTTGSTVEWSVEDASIATVDQNGTVTGVSAGETTVTATIDGVAYTIPVVIRQDATSSSTKVYDFYLSEVTDTTVYMSVSVSTDLVEVQEGEAIYICFDSTADTSVDFFGTPYEGYALTRMSSTNSAGDYMALNSTDPTQTDFYTKDGAAGKNQRNTFGDTAVANMVQAALDKDCDGGMGWTRPSGNTGTVTSDLTFRSEKLPTVSKEVATVNGVPYTAGMVAHQGEKVVFNVTVTQYAAQDAITYSNVILTDNLSGATFTGSSSSTKTVTDLSNTAVDSDTTFTYQVEYTITEKDLDTTIANTVDLTYTYQSAYSSGSFGGEAKADAKISAVTFDPDDYVIDFGLPVQFDFSGTDAHGRYDLVSGSANYGDVSVSGNVVTYTPTTILKGIDTITLTNTAGGTYTFKVYPATTVYYEEGFAVSGENTGTAMQATQIAGSSTDEYGYDAAYASTVGESNGTDVKLSGSNTFTFTGSGVDIYTNNDTSTGRLMVRITNANNSLVKMAQVSTAMQDGLTSATEGQEVNGYNVPVFSVDNLTRGTYTVTLTVLSGDVYLDGFRVYNTLDPNTEAYRNDLEDNPAFIELRDKVIASLAADVNTDASIDDALYAGQIARNLFSQVYARGTDTDGVVITSNAEYTNEQLLDLIDNGPKNEIYLQPGQALTFKITTAREVQIGLKALNAATTYTITGKNGDQTLNSSTDMFYTVLNKGTSGEQTITITNKGTGILAVTKLKVCDDPNFSFAELTEEDLIPALVSLGYELEPEEPVVEYADATLTVEVNGQTTTLTRNGVVGESVTFTAAEIEAAAKDLVPDGYELKDQAEDVTVAYGQSTTVSLSAEEIPTEPEKPEKPEKPSNPEKPATPSTPANIISSVVDLINKIIGSIKGFFR